MSSNPTQSEATNAEHAKNPNEGSDWQEKAGRMGTGNIAGIADESTEEAYQQNGQSWLSANQGDGSGGQGWLGGPQNGNETPSEAEKTLQEKSSSDIPGPTGSGKWVNGTDQYANENPGKPTEDATGQSKEKPDDMGPFGSGGINVSIEAPLKSLLQTF